MEDGERRSQSNSGEYYWLGPELTQNTRGRYIPIFPAANIFHPAWPRSKPITIVELIATSHHFCGGYYNMYMLRRSS